MYKNYLIDYVIRAPKNHPLSSCSWHMINLNTTNNNLITNQKQIYNILLDIISISGQYPKIKKAKKSISAFNVRKNLSTGTLTNLKNLQLQKFLKFFIFSIIPTIPFKYNMKSLIDSTNFWILNIGFNDLSSWHELKKASNTGLHIQFVIKQKAKHKDFLFFLSKYKLNFTK